MKFGICTSIDNIDALAAMGFDYLECNVSQLAGLSDEDFAARKEQAQKASIPVSCFNVLFPKAIKVIGPDYNKEATAEYLNKAFSRVQALGGTTVVFGSGGARKRPDDVDFFSAYRQLVEVTKQIGEIADKYGVTIVIEPLNRGETNMINSMAEGAQLAADVNLPNVKLLTDFFHVAKDGEPVEDVERIGAFAHVHIASGKGRLYPLPGQDEQYPLFFQCLKKIGYNGRVSIEGKTEDMMKDAPIALAYMKGLAGE
jgi:sugar phosphate isomerase/epimerase